MSNHQTGAIEELAKAQRRTITNFAYGKAPPRKTAQQLSENSIRRAVFVGTLQALLIVFVAIPCVLAILAAIFHAAAQ